MDIRVVDNFLTDDELQFTVDIIKNEKWYYGSISNLNNNIKWFGFDLYNNLFFTEYLLQQIIKITKCNWECLRVYANGQTPLLDGDWHTDRDSPCDDYYTVLLYTSDITKENVDKVNGHTEFKINNEIKYIEPLKNRLVIFNSGISHRGRAPCIPEIFRVSIAWKLKKII